MKLILSSLLLSASIAIVCAAPGAFSSSSSAFEQAASSSIVAAAAAEAEESAVPTTVDPREAAWTRMKIALPDGVFQEDRLTAERLQHTSDEKVVPMIVMSKNDFPPAYLLKKPLYKHQRVPLAEEEEEGPAYKHMGAAASKENFSPVLVAPLLPEAQEELNMEHQLEQEEEEAKADTEAFLQTGNRYKNLVAISDTGVYEHIQLPRAGESSKPETLEVEEQVLPQGVSEKKLVGVDKMGKMRYIDVPYYNRVRNAEKDI